MITNTPIADLSATISYGSMQTYVIIMIVLVVVMTILDMLHKKSAQYFFEKAEKAKEEVKEGITLGNSKCSIGNEANRFKELSTGDKVGIAANTLVTDVATSGEFKNNPTRRLVHLLTMYGFILFVATTAIMIFNQSGNSTALTAVWHIGALMLLVGSFWFWFVFRVDVAAEGKSPFDIEIRRDMFSLSLMATSVTALAWSITGGGTGAWFVLLILATASLFGGVYWSKFSHMFFKPAAAYNKRIIKADGQNEELPHQNRDMPEERERYSMSLLKDAPMDMGLGIKREKPNHY